VKLIINHVFIIILSLVSGALKADSVSEFISGQLRHSDDDLVKELVTANRILIGERHGVKAMHNILLELLNGWPSDQHLTIGFETSSFFQADIEKFFFNTGDPQRLFQITQDIEFFEEVSSAAAHIRNIKYIAMDIDMPWIKVYQFLESKDDQPLIADFEHGWSLPYEQGFDHYMDFIERFVNKYPEQSRLVEMPEQDRDQYMFQTVKNEKPFIGFVGGAHAHKVRVDLSFFGGRQIEPLGYRLNSLKGGVVSLVQWTFPTNMQEVAPYAPPANHWEVFKELYLHDNGVKAVGPVWMKVAIPQFTDPSLGHPAFVRNELFSQPGYGYDYVYVFADNQ